MLRSSMEQPMSDVNIMLLGSTGSGKSASGNTIIGVKGTFKEGFSPSSVTRIFQSAQTKVDGQRITVIDTVGISDTEVKKITDAQTQIEQILQNTNLDVILLVIKLGETFTKEKIEAVKWIHDNFGAKVSKHTIVLFTHGDKLDMSVEKYVSECEKLRSVVDQCSGGFHVFKNRDYNDRQCQVNELLKKIESLRMMNGNRRYTEKDYARAQKDLLIKKCATGAAVGGGAGALAGAAGGAAIAAKVGTAVLTAGKAAAIGATGGAALLAVAAGFGVYFLARKYKRSSSNSKTMKSGNKKQK